MSPPPQNKQALRELKQAWYRRLREEGFEDIEEEKSDKLKSWHSFYFQVRHKPLSFDVKREYYYRARQYLSYGLFSSQVERTIWEMHSEGEALRQISAHIGGSYNKDKVSKIVGIIKHRMDLGLRGDKRKWNRKSAQKTPSNETQLSLFEDQIWWQLGITS